MKVLVLAGEASGDRMAAGVARALRAIEPSAEIRAMGGDALRHAGATILVDSTRLAVVGISEVAGVLPDLLRARGRLVDELARWRPDVVVPVDYPDFNLFIARRARRLGIPVAWLVSPQVWAWRPGRITTFARAVSRMLVLFAFEVDIWQRAGVPAEHVGHPLLDEPPPPSRAEARAFLGLPPETPVLAVLPGSRRSEAATTWPVFAEAAGMLARRRPDLRVVVPVAPALDEGRLPAALAAPAQVLLARDAMAMATSACDVAVVASGTATLETALVPRALVVGYRVSRATMALSRLLANRAFLERGLFCLPNLVLNRAVVPELYQERFRADAIAAAAGALLDDPGLRETMLRELEALRAALGGPGAAARIAASVRDIAARGR